MDNDKNKVEFSRSQKSKNARRKALKMKPPLSHDKQDRR